MKPNSKIGHASDNLERFTDIVLRHSTNFQKLLNVAKSVHFKMLKHYRYSTIYRHVKKKVLINAKNTNIFKQSKMASTYIQSRWTSSKYGIKFNKCLQNTF